MSVSVTSDLYRAQSKAPKGVGGILYSAAKHTEESTKERKGKTVKTGTTSMNSGLVKGQKSRVKNTQFPSPVAASLLAGSSVSQDAIRANFTISVKPVDIVKKVEVVSSMIQTTLRD